MLTKLYGSAVFGISAVTITIEVHIALGIGYHLVGMPDNAVKESHYRIAAALLNNGYRIPGKKITINMAPAALKKEGAAYDLTLAFGILLASSQLKGVDSKDYLIMGELSLDGSILPVKGVLAMAIQALEEGFKGIVIPKENEAEAGLIVGIAIIGVSHLTEVVHFFSHASHQLSFSSHQASNYTITLSAGEGGTVSTTGGEYEAGQTVSVTATPQGEYVFTSWSDGNTDATRTITISSNSTLTANFEKRKYPLTVNFEGEGEVIEEIVNAGRTTEYDSGTTVKLTAQAAAEWVFVGWTGAIESTEESVQIVIGEPKEVTATFEKEEIPFNSQY